MLASLRHAVTTYCRVGARSLVKGFRRSLFKISRKRCEAAVRKLVGPGTDILFVHSSLSGCGYICDGERTVLSVLNDFCSLLCLPTHTYCYPADPSEVGPLYDPRATESLVGRITNCFWRSPGVVRSIHPTHSLAASGPGAVAICQDHEKCETPCGPGTPYTKLIALRAGVLMFGAPMNTYTLFHTAEDAAGCDYLYEPQRYRLRALTYEGSLCEIPMRRQDWRIRRRFDEAGLDLEKAGLLRRQRLGRGDLRFIPDAQAAHNFVLERLKLDSHYLVSKAH